MHIHSYFIGWRLVKCHRALAKRIKFGKRYDILNLTCHAILKTRAQWQRLMETKKITKLIYKMCQLTNE